MIRYSIYIVDDDPAIRDSLTTALEGSYEVRAFSSGEDALEELARNSPDLMLLDIGLPGKNGMDVLSDARDLCPDTLVVMITAHEEVSMAVSAMRLGAYDYILKPLALESIELTVRKALETIRLRKEVKILQEKHLIENVPFFIGESDVIRDVTEFISMVAKSATTPVLILGETGTGKELIAKAIHFRSTNFNGPLVTVNCAALPKELIESELFGYEKGAFSGAKTSGKRGWVQEAEGGTLFLDEVGDLSPEAQAKLLRFLEDGEFYRLGGTEKLHVQARVISATNKNIEDLIRRGLFRDDLYYRLGVVKMRIPSLNERRDDILPLAKHFLVEFSRDFGKEFSGISPEAAGALKVYDWRGNVRELKNLIERGVLVGKGKELTLQDLGIGSSGKEPILEQEWYEPGFPPILPEGIDFPSVLESFEKFYIEQALELAGGNESKAAKLLNMNHHTFRYHRKKLQIR
jgi:DNA-binding NtrC family response regulator